MTHHPATSASSGNGPGILLGIAVVILLLAALLGGLWINNSTPATEAEDAARSAERTKNLTELQVADAATLNTYGWNDRAKGVVRVPVTRAMELMLPTLNKVQQ
jgi:flagellar basal body-associated protein FliL